MRVLVVEDEERLAWGVKAELSADGFAVDVSHDGVDALWRVRERTYDAIVLDLMVPGPDRYRLCATLREEGIWIPILVLSARDGERDEVDALNSGADDFLTKPFTHAVLVARLRALMRRQPRELPTALSVGDLRIDLSQRRVSRGDAEIELTSREFAILEYLARRPGEIVSKQDVLDNVWDEQFDGDPNLIEVYVGRLRDKLDRPSGRNPIETVRGAGYRLAGGGG